MLKTSKYYRPPLIYTRNKGSGLLIMTIIAAVIISMTAVSLAKVHNLALNTLSSNKTAMQAQQYAAAKADFIKLVKYDNLTAQNRTIIQSSNGYQDEVIISPESIYPNNNKIKQKLCTINVYKGNEPIPRSTLIVTRLSTSVDNSVPKGSILPWYGKISDIPNGFALCNGKNGTPDLQNRFIVGSGDTYQLGDIGGESEVTLEADQNVSHYHRFGYHNGNNNGYFLTSSGNYQPAPLADWMRAGKWNGSGGGWYEGWDGGSGTNFGRGQNLVTSLSIGADASRPHENRPPYYALYYIMKL